MKYFYLYQNKKIEYLFFESVEASIIDKFLKKNLIFLHGINDPAQNHLELYKEFVEKGNNVYAINFPGHGNSDKFDDISWDLLVNIVQELININELKNITLVGYSLGGAVALKLLERNSSIMQVGLISPYCYPIDFKNIWFLGSALKFVFRDYSQRLRYLRGKALPYATNAQYILSKYKHLFTETVHFNLDNLKANLNLVVLGKDEMIKSKKVNEYFGKFPNIKITQLDNFTHNIYYISPNETKILCDLLLSK